VDPISEPLRMYGQVSDIGPLEWSWVRSQLEAAGTYWVVARPDAHPHPHPRPVWGVWVDGALWLSIGSPVVARQLTVDPAVTVHLDSGTDVVAVEAVATEVPGGDLTAVVAAYDAKYDWHYTVDEYGPLTRLEPATVVAWRAAAWAGRDGFRQVGRWRFA
jgi:hypothetical protein